MDDLYVLIGRKIQSLRKNHGGKGINQEELGMVMGTTSNTISRWESGIYKPSAKDLHKLSKYFHVNISTFFPETENPLLQALTSATGQLRENELEELISYAQFRAGRRQLEETKSTRKRKK